MSVGMKQGTLGDRIGNVRDILWLAGIISSLVSALLMVIAVGFWTLFGPQIVKTIQDTLGITDLYKVMGANRITNMPAGLSYVREPVRFGEKVILVLHVGRTERGKDCEYKGSIPLFTDENGSTFAGQPQSASQQLGTQITRSIIALDQPAGIAPGHAILQLQLEYVCEGRTMFENTLPMTFTILGSNP